MCEGASWADEAVSQKDVVLDGGLDISTDEMP
jgi:hypothetical protein